MPIIKSNLMFSPDEETFRKSTVIRPPTKDAIAGAERMMRYVIDSRDRNLNTFPDPAKYDIMLPQDINNVTQVRLVIADVPFVRYLVHANNNILTVSESDPVNGVYQETAVSLAMGDYSEADLASNVEAALNAACRATFTVQYVSHLDKYTIKSSLVDKQTQAATSFYMLCQGPTVPYGPRSYDRQGGVYGDATSTYRPKTAAVLLGFSNKNYASDVTGAIVAPFRKNFNKERYIGLSVSRAEYTYGTSANIDRIFCIIDDKENSLNDDHKSDTIKIFDPPLNSLRKLQIAFVDYYGNLYDFQNQDHRLELEFTVQPFT